MTDCRTLDTPLPDGAIEIEDAGGACRRLEGEALLVACAGHYSGMKPLAVGDPGAVSLLSGKPAWTLRIEGVEFGLTLDEIAHLALNALPAAQVLKLRETCGRLTLIGPDYYDADGRALQPKVRVPAS